MRRRLKSAKVLNRLVQGLAAAVITILFFFSAASEASAQVTFSKAFLTDPVAPGATTTLRYTITNNTILPLTVLNFSDNLGAVIPGMQAVGLPSISLCGVASILTGTSTVSLVSGALLPGGSCNLDVTVQVPVNAPAGTYTSTSGPLINLAAQVAPGAGDTLTIAGPPQTPPVFSASFTPASVALGTATRLTYTIDNSANVVAATNLAFSNTLPLGLLVAGLPNVSTTCAGTLSAAAGTSTVALVNGSVAAGASCAISIDLVGLTLGNLVNTTGALVSSLGNSGAATATVQILNALAQASFSKQFIGDPAAPGSTATLRYTITNTGLAPLAALTFTDNLNAAVPGLQAVGLPSLSLCGVASVLAGTTQVSLLSGALLPGASCELDVSVQIPVGAVPGTYASTSGPLLEALIQVAPGASDSLTIAGAAQTPPAFTASFLPAAITLGGTARLTLSIDNSAATLPATGLAFVDTLPIGLVIAAVPDVSADCAGSLTAQAGTSTIALVGGEVAAGASCTISLDVTGQAVGSVVNTTGALVSSLGNSGAASAALEVLDAVVEASFTKAFIGDPVAPGGTAVLRYTLTNTGLTPLVALNFTDNLDAALPGLTATGLPAASLCGIVSVVSGTSQVSLLSGALLPGATCMFDVTVAVPGDAAAGNYASASSPLFEALVPMATGAADTLTVDGIPQTPPVFSADFDPASITLGGTTTLTFTIDNSASADAATGLTFSDALPLGLVVADPANAANTCAGTLTASPGASSITLAGGSVAAGATCTIQVDLFGLALGSLVNTTGNLVSSLGSSGPATAVVEIVNAIAQASFTKTFIGAPVPPGGPATLRYTITNTALLPLVALNFTDDLDAALPGLVASGLPIIADCGVASIVAGTSQVSLVAGALLPTQSCVLDVTVAVPADAAPGTYTSTSNPLYEAVLQVAGGASASLEVNGAASGAPLFSASFVPASIMVGDGATLTLIIDNSAGLVPATALAFSDALPAGLVVGVVGASGTCGGTLVAIPGTALVSLSGGSVAAGAECAITIGITAIAAGSYENTTGDLTSSLGNSGPATATLQVGWGGAVLVSAAFTPAQIGVGEEAALTIVFDNSGSLLPATGLSIGDSDLPSPLMLSATPDATTTCIGGSIVAPPNGDLFSYSGGAVAGGAICTLSLSVIGLEVGVWSYASDPASSSFGESGPAFAILVVQSDDQAVVAETQSVIKRFMQRRADLMTAEDPDLTTSLQGKRPQLPMRFHADVTPEGTVMQFATSIEQMRGALAELREAYGPETKALRELGRYPVDDPARAPFDIWIEGAYTAFRDDTDEGEGAEGVFGRLYLGGEWRARPNLTLGLMAQFDTMSEDDGEAGDAEVSGNGWMAGPYVAARFGSNVYAQLRAAYGRSDNEVSPFGTYEDDFETERWLVSGKVRGSFVVGAWEIAPTVGALYFREKQLAYDDANGFEIPSQVVELGRLTFGPEISYRAAWGGAIVQPSLSLVGLYDFLQGDTLGIGDAAADRLRARATAGLDVLGEGGERLRLSAFYDGIGGDGFEAVGGKARIVLPLQRPE